LSARRAPLPCVLPPPPTVAPTRRPTVLTLFKSKEGARPARPPTVPTWAGRRRWETITEAEIGQVCFYLVCRPQPLYISRATPRRTPARPHVRARRRASHVPDPPQDWVQFLLDEAAGTLLEPFLPAPAPAPAPADRTAAGAGTGEGAASAE